MVKLNPRGRINFDIPSVFRLVSHPSRGGLCVSYSCSLFKLAEVIGDSFKFEFRLVPDGKFGTVGDNGKWDGMLGELLNGVSLL